MNLPRSEDYATIDNTVALDGDFLDGSCTSLPTSVPAGWRLADWDANIALVSDYFRYYCDPHLSFIFQHIKCCDWMFVFTKS